MPLTLEALRAKEFTTVRLRHGYRPQEVDEFLDEVEEEFCELLRANEALRNRLAAAALGGREADQHTHLGGAPGPPPADGRQNPSEKSATNAQRLLELAQQVADKEVTAARREAEATIAAAQRRATDLEAAARSAAHALEQQTREECRSVLNALEADRSALEAEIDRLRTVEREYRSKVKSFLRQQMQHLEPEGAGTDLVTAAQTSDIAPSRDPQLVGRQDTGSHEETASTQHDAPKADPASGVLLRLDNQRTRRT
ncbi:DivIVA domain-containing protein [Kitasatospora sp. NPDC085879]|uniref:DivIVA domain-containing protein n=1 Tax=Kitasatospora sp. NPDC085879 TaxID=3154769 RepID=UPI003419F722